MSDATINPAITSRILAKLVLTTRPVREYRGVALPSLGHFEPLPTDGDIYLVMSTPYRVFYYASAQWHEWDGSMPNTRHPKTDTMFLYPARKHITWGDYRSRQVTIRTIHKTFTATATVHDYVAFILRNEAESDPARIARAQRRREKRTLKKATTASGSTPVPAATTTKATKKRKRSASVGPQSTPVNAVGTTPPLPFQDNIHIGDPTTEATALTLTDHRRSPLIDPMLLEPEPGIAFVSRQAPMLAPVSEHGTATLPNIVASASAPPSSPEQVNPCPPKSITPSLGPPSSVPTTNAQGSGIASQVVSNDHERLVRGIAGFQFPAQSEPVNWDILGVQVHLPWIARRNQASKDAQEVAKLMRYPLATKPINGKTIIKALPAPARTSTNQEMQSFYTKVHEALGNGMLVVVQGWRSEFFTEFTLRSLEDAGCSVDQIVCAHDMQRRLTRGNDKPFFNQSLRYLVEKADNPTVCYNLLELTPHRLDVPFWLPHLIEDSVGWMSSLGLDIPVPKNNIDDAPAVEAHKDKGKAKASKTKFTVPELFPGPKVVLHDQVRSENWVLVTHGGAYTQLHHDVAGLSTYIIANCGAKIWVPSGPPLSTPVTTRQELFDAFDCLFLTGCERPDLERFGGSILLEPGDVLLQPPGIFHEVYTPVKSIASGGHFFMYHSLHLTEIARAFDAGHHPEEKPHDLRSHYTTNNEHPGAPRQLSRMLLALPRLTLSRTFYRRPILSLVRMVRDFALEARKMLDTESEMLDALLALVKKKGLTLQLPQLAAGIKASLLEEVDKETCHEHIAAHHIGVQIVTELGLSWDDVSLELDQYSVDWTCPGEPIDLTFLLPEDARDA